MRCCIARYAHGLLQSLAAIHANRSVPESKTRIGENRTRSRAKSQANIDFKAQAPACEMSPLLDWPGVADLVFCLDRTRICIIELKTSVHSSKKLSAHRLKCAMREPDGVSQHQQAQTFTTIPVDIHNSRHQEQQQS